MEMDKAGGGTGIIGTSVLPVGEQGLLTSTRVRSLSMPLVHLSKGNKHRDMGERILHKVNNSKDFEAPSAGMSCSSGEATVAQCPKRWGSRWGGGVGS